MKLALFGKNISHSRSQEMYETIFQKKIAYDLLDYKSESDIPKDMVSFLEENNYYGVSITSPYKKYFAKICSHYPAGKNFVGINCLKVVDGKLIGTNTDYLALKLLLDKFSCSFKSYIILGNGIMSQVIEMIFLEKELKYQIFSRKKNGDISTLDLSNNSNGLIINCCSREFEFKGKISESTIFWDMNYSHKHHQSYFEKNEGQYLDGSSLLFEQAKYATEFWSNF